jgi:hypothetical protein
MNVFKGTKIVAKGFALDERIFTIAGKFPLIFVMFIIQLEQTWIAVNSLGEFQILQQCAFGSKRKKPLFSISIGHPHEFQLPAM